MRLGEGVWGRGNNSRAIGFTSFTKICKYIRAQFFYADYTKQNQHCIIQDKNAIMLLIIGSHKKNNHMLFLSE